MIDRKPLLIVILAVGAFLVLHWLERMSNRPDPTLQAGPMLEHPGSGSASSAQSAATGAGPLGGPAAAYGPAMQGSVSPNAPLRHAIMPPPFNPPDTSQLIQQAVGQAAAQRRAEEQVKQRKPAKPAKPASVAPSDQE